MTMPSETITGVVGSIVASVLVVLGLFTDTSKITPEVVGAIVALVSWTAFGITLVVRARRRSETETRSEGTP
jgi:uncharacterized membrane protein YeaQ/YmgE (transglycosylase-associated protein family)